MIRRKLIWHLFPSYLLVALVTLLPAAVYSSRPLCTFYVKQARQEPKQLPDLVAQEDRPGLAIVNPIAQVRGSGVTVESKWVGRPLCADPAPGLIVTASMIVRIR